MLESIRLKFTEHDDLEVPVRGVTIFVGPNNSGKSLVLREIQQALDSHPFPSGLQILSDYEIVWPSVEEAAADLDERIRRAPAHMAEGQVLISNIHPIAGFSASQYHKEAILNVVRARTDKRWWATQVIKHSALRLDGRSRFELTNDKHGGDLLAPPQNQLSYLFVNDEARERVRSLVYDAFGSYFVIDPTNSGQLRIRLSSVAPLSDEQSLNAAAREFHSRALHIKEASDGVQAFTGIALATLTGEFRVILIDEPEAFLHPPLARKLGRHLGRLTSERSGNLLASTHSPEFLMGCVQATSEVRIVRLEYSGGRSRGKMVSPSRLQEFLKKPLVRSANVISGLFHDGVAITESDNDRVFYSEIYHRLSVENETLPSILFINAQNKQTMRDVMGPLREFGVPAVAIPDVDFVKDGGSNWTQWMSAGRIPDPLHIPYGQQRAAICQLLNSTGGDMKSGGGVNLLSGSDRAAADAFFDLMDSYGIFIVRNGELEDWLKGLKVSGRKTGWAVEMLERLGSDPDSSSYVKPSTDDVWAFMLKVARWIQTPSRLGM